MLKANDVSVSEIDQLVRRLEGIPDREARETARSLVEAVLRLHGEGLQKIMDALFESGDAGKTAIRRFAADPLISSLLVLHDLHPDDLETRVRHSLKKLHGAAEVIGIFEGTVRVRLTSNSCGLRDSVETSIRQEVPDAGEIIIEEFSGLSNNFVPIESLERSAVRAAEHA